MEAEGINPLKELKAILQLALISRRKEKNSDLPKSSRDTICRFPFMIKCVEAPYEQMTLFLRTPLYVIMARIRFHSWTRNTTL
jgi:hypothetical protein